MCSPQVPNTAASSDNQTALDFAIRKIRTKPIEGQKTGTSGMRKKTSVLLGDYAFIPNWIQSLFNALGAEKTKDATLILGGDGRFFIMK